MWSSSTLLAGTQAVASQPVNFFADKSDADLEAELRASHSHIQSPNEIYTHRIQRIVLAGFLNEKNVFQMDANQIWVSWHDVGIFLNQYVLSVS